jgi:threonine/homoserine/homoserine lactone efflux protein
MFEPSTLLAYVLACAAIIVVPGPTISVIVANSLRSGAAAGLANVAGTQVGLLLMAGVLAVGLDAVVAFMGEAFFWVKIAGAAYLVYLGIKLWRSDGRLGRAEGEARSLRGYALQGFLVILSNPKSLLFFGAFIPQFVDPAQNTAAQVFVLAGIFICVATVIDGSYALIAGRAGRLLTRGRVRLAEKISGTFLVCGGLWLALQRR